MAPRAPDGADGVDGAEDASEPPILLLEEGAAAVSPRLSTDEEAKPDVGEAKPEAKPPAEVEEAKPDDEETKPESPAPAASAVTAGSTTEEAEEAKPEVEEAKPDVEETNADFQGIVQMEIISGVLGLRRRTLSTVVNSLSFTMGLAWLTFTKVVVVDDCCGELEQSDAPRVWLCFAIAVAILLPVTVLIIRRRLHLDRLSEAAYAEGKMDDAEQLHARALVYQTMVSWAVGFTLAAQLSAAASASLPASPWGWKLLYALSLLFLVVVLAFVVFGIGICMGRDTRVLESISDVIVSGAAYTIALAFLDAVTTAFSLKDISSTSDADFLFEFFLATCTVVALGTAILGWLDYRDAADTAKEWKQINQAAQQGVVAVVKKSFVRQFVHANIRKLLSKTLSMCGVAVSYVCFYAWLLDWDLFDDGASSVSEPFAFWGAMVFFVTCLAVAVIGSLLIEYNIKRMRKHITKFDPFIPGTKYDDWVMASLVMLLQTTYAALLEGLSWLVGTALHSWSIVGYSKVVREGDQADFLRKAAASFIFAMALSAVTPLAMLKLAPPPLQGGTMKPHAK